MSTTLTSWRIFLLGVDPCGERGEFHTFCYRCPEFSTEIPVTVGDVVDEMGSGLPISD